MNPSQDTDHGVADKAATAAEADSKAATPREVQSLLKPIVDRQHNPDPTRAR